MTTVGAFFYLNRQPSASAVLVALLCGTTSAQPITTAPPAPSEPRNPHPPSGIGASFALGRAGDAWLARLDYDVLPVMAPTRTVGPVFGFMPGIEYWRGAGDSGFAIPIAILMGIRAFPGRATIGLGFDAIVIDSVNDDVGFGLWAPFVSANLGLDIDGFRLGVDARIVRRWQFGADDFTQWQLAIFAGRTIEPPPRSARAARP